MYPITPNNWVVSLMVAGIIAQVLGKHVIIECLDP